MRHCMQCHCLEIYLGVVRVINTCYVSPFMLYVLSDLCAVCGQQTDTSPAGMLMQLPSNLVGLDAEPLPCPEMMPEACCHKQWGP
jgi:hypothetical protein